MSQLKKLMKEIIILLISFIFCLLPFFSVPCWAQNNVFPITLTDDNGITTTITEEPQRIVSTAPSHTEIIFSLGLDKKLVGVTDYCKYPEKARTIESIGKMSPLNLEKIASLKPDLIIAYGGFQLKEIPRLKELDFKVVVLEPKSIEEMLDCTQIIADACGISEKGKQVVSDFNHRIDRIKSDISSIPVNQQPKILAASSYETIYSPGAGTLFNELITLAGGQNITSQLQGWSKIGPEFIAQAEPDIIIIPTGAMNATEISKIKNDIMNHPGWSNIPAIKNHQLFRVDEDLFYRAGPRLLDGLELLYEIFQQAS